MKHPIPLWTDAPPPATSSSDIFSGPVTALDVRPLLAQGEEPFEAIMEAVAGLPPDGVLELTAPFAPVPLYGVLAERGFAHLVEQRGAGEFVVRFAQTGIRPSTPVQVVMGRYPATAPLFAEYGFDLCCGGRHSLEFAAKAHGVELATVLARLQAAAIT
jgi:uncharacterized protein (DUF2249 family)